MGCLVQEGLGGLGEEKEGRGGKEDELNGDGPMSSFL